MTRWDEASTGLRLGPMEFALTPKLADRWARGTGNDLPVHREFVDPTGAGNLAIRVLGAPFPGPIIHSHQDLEFFAPVRIGETLIGTGEVSRREERRGKAYVAVDCEFARPDGQRVWWARMTCVWPEVHLERGDQTASARTEGPPGRPPDGAPTLTKHVTQDDMTLYSGPGNIHSDLGVARSVGLEATIAQGMMTMAYASELLTRHHGDDWLSRGAMGVRFLAPVFDADAVTVWLTDSPDGHDVAASNQHGRLVMTGAARLR